jgi:hypothetical protein
MEQILLSNKDLHVPIVTERLWFNARNILQRNLDTVVNFYNEAPMVVKGDHFLVRLLHSIPVSTKLDTLRYYENVSDIAMTLSNAMKFTSPISQGKVRSDYLLNNGSNEIIIGTDESFDVRDADKNWKKLRPLEFLRHPRSDLGFNLPDGIKSGGEAGFVVAKVNIPMLALQYRNWLMEEDAIALETGRARLTTAHFVHQYVLPNSMFSYMDLVVLNRFHNLVIGKPLGVSTRRLPCALVSMNAEVLTAPFAIIKELMTKNMNLQALMRNIPLLTAKNMYEIIGLPEVVMTQQVTWAFAIARFPMLDLLFNITSKGQGNAYQMEVNELLKFIKSLRVNNRLSAVLTGDAYYDAKTEMEDLEILAKAQ